VDGDGDGYGIGPGCAEQDCDDSRNDVYPDATEDRNAPGISCADGLDNDCDQLTDMEDPACWECTLPADCDDGNVCTNEQCNGHLCGHTNNNGAGCSDGNACTQTDTCQGATCTGANPVVCTALDSCHDVGICDTGTGVCSDPSKAEFTSCDDLLFCNGADNCDGSGNCSLHSGNPCGVLFCDEGANSCLGAAGLGLVFISAGSDHVCGLTAAGLAYCWGDDTYGQLGNGGTSQVALSPSLVDTSTVTGNKAFVQYTGGYYHSCGLTAAGVAYCWGRDDQGQLGNGGGSQDVQSPSPVNTAGIAGNKAFKDLVAGGTSSTLGFTCGVTADGVTYCWGSDSDGQLGNGSGSGSSQTPSPVDTTTITGNKAFVQLAAGGRHACGLTADGVAYCWGGDESGQLGNGGASQDTQSPSPVNTATITGNKAFLQLVAGEYHTCGLTVEGVAYCWGWNRYGELGTGNGSPQDVQSPSAVDTSTITGNKKFVQLTARISTSTCGLTADGVAYCWGSDYYGQLGNGGTAQDTWIPSAVNTAAMGGNKTFVQLSAGYGFTCGLTASGVAYCFGEGGTIGDGTWNAAQSPTLVNTAAVSWSKVFVQLSPGTGHTCGRTTDGAAHCWGLDDGGQLGNGGGSLNTQSLSPVNTSTIPGNRAFVHLAAAYAHTCGLMADGVAYCWGSDYLGRVGNGTVLGNSQSPSPVDTSTISGNKAFVQIGAGYGFGCVLNAEGVAYCWGKDAEGNLGNGGTAQDTENPSLPVDTFNITGNKAFVRLTIGSGSHACGLTGDGVAYCWGYDSNGQLGNGGGSLSVQRPSPVDTSTMTGNKTFVQLAAGGRHTCGLTAAGVCYCWGSDGSGQLGNGGGSTDTQSPSPVNTLTIPGNKAFIKIVAGNETTCGLTADGVAYCWGWDDSGNLGNGSGLGDSQSPSPVDTSTIAGNKLFVLLDSGDSHACGLTAGGVAYCWGWDGSGQLGNGGTSQDTESPSPVDVSGLWENAVMKLPIPFGKYLLLERINAGGMAEVYLARSRTVEGFKRTLAIKKILSSMADDDEFITMFIDEARIAAELSHTGIVQIHELGKHGDDYYITMEFVHGRDLRYIQEKLRRDRAFVDVPMASLISVRICEALSYAHNKKDFSGKPMEIIHRDISPQNVLISFDGDVKICDFGIAKAANSSFKTQVGVLKGKFGYMSPEQARGFPLDCRSDIFTVGTLLYEMLTQERLFMGECDFSTLEKVRNAEVILPTTINKKIPKELEDIILKALAKRPEDRFQSAAAFGEAIETVILRQQWPISSRDLANFMRTTFSDERKSELRRLEEYEKLPDPPMESEKKETGDGEGIKEDVITAPLQLNTVARTLIFASKEPGEIIVPPPLPRNRKEMSLVVGKEKNSSQKESEGDDDDQSDEPTSRDQNLPKRLAAATAPKKTVQGGARTYQEKYFVPLLIVAALALLWAIFATVRKGSPPQISPPQMPPATDSLILQPLDIRPVSNEPLGSR
jgi:alpha-tubulin suppressor-like RCC1 family protein/serine/threonine protein kinase